MKKLIKKFVKSFLPQSWRLRLLKLRNSIKSLFTKTIQSLFTKMSLLASLYYMMSTAFRREHHAVLSGIVNHERHPQKGNYYTLRRNIHRLEKGLLMRPRRDIFATGYIEETVDKYRALRNCKEINETIAWAYSVLREYFSVVTDSHPNIKAARKKFGETVNECDSDNIRIPYQRCCSLSSQIPSFQQLKNLAKLRRSVRWYLQKPVPRDLIDQALSVATLSPSACNRQPFEFIILDDNEKVKEIASLPGGTAGFFDNIPVIIVIIGHLNAFFSERDRHLIYIDAALASMSFMLALETLGLSSCPINWPEIESLERKMTKILSLKNDERVIMLLSVGYADPDGYVAYSQKKSLDELRHYR
ncbi:Nitroreductase-like protein [Candidatus Thiomargarita nelsonii]|uniref:Nitroreductase-like protein n=1 Tax=Candidatus Thiomargarita nelsonii TaxID=1003181 RepID=A0A176RWV9_9GAMM|nr:Nitroreductase-like protein [Candidatus Thiomargarita nelsonii]